MKTQKNPTAIEVETYPIGVASIVLSLLKRLGIAEIIDSVLTHQPEVEVSYGKLALVVIINRLSFDPQPLYAMRDWAERHGIDRLLGIEAAWLDDDWGAFTNWGRLPAQTKRQSDHCPKRAADAADD